jgi:hypothetical protein
MAMKKTGESEKLEVVYTGREASVVHDHLLKTGKALSDFDNEERAALDSDLESVKDESEGGE